jgi:DNA polymerase-3 subunit epsilon
VREIALDTETTGLSFADCDRIIEIGCVELIDKRLTGKTFHTYVNPQREVGESSTEITGLTYEFLKNYKVFEDVYEEFLEFIADDRLVIHNARFDVGFLNFELSLVGGRQIKPDNVVDTLAMAHEKYPGSPATLDALCRRFSIDSTIRTKHGALIDAELLAGVYLSMSVEVVQRSIICPAVSETLIEAKQLLTEIREFNPSKEEIEKHRNFLKKIKSPIWESFLEDSDANSYSKIL